MSLANYAYANLYPGWGNGVNQKEETVPDPDEQTAIQTMDSPAAQNPVDPKSKLNMTLLLVFAGLLILVFGAGK